MLEPAQLVVEHCDADAFEHRAHARAVEPPVVIAEHREHAERRRELAERACPVLRRDREMADHAVRHIVAEQQDQVGLGRVGPRRHVGEFFNRHERRAGVQIGQQGDPERRLRFRPCRKRQIDLANDQAIGLDGEAPNREAGRKGGQDTQKDDPAQPTARAA